MSDNKFGLPDGIHTVVLGVADINGIMRGKRIPATHWDEICKNGNALSMVLLAMDMTSDVWDTPVVNMDNGYPDMLMFPASKPVVSAWEDGVAFCMGKTMGMDGKPVPIDPRNVLIEQLERAKSLGFEVQIGPELEFYLLDPETLQPRDQGIQVYSLSRAAELEHVVGPIRQKINEMGIPIEQSNPEYAPGQVEVNIHYDSALLSADRIVMFRSLVKELAHAHGYLASFMAKPFIDLAGSGFHAHYSFWKDGKNAFADNGKLNDTGLAFLAGLQQYMPEISLAGSTTPNAYKRRAPYTFSPTNNSWGYDNRTVGLRVIEGNDSAVRVEKRDASADCNPYYLFACDIAAGLDGIEGKMTPTPPCTSNAYTAEGFELLPRDLTEAVRLAEGSELMQKVLGKDRLTILAQQATRELEFLAQQVTDVEIQRYLRNF